MGRGRGRGRGLFLYIYIYIYIFLSIYIFIYLYIYILYIISVSVTAKKLMRKKNKEDEQTLEELNSGHRRSQAKCQLIQTSYIKRIYLLLFSPYNKHLISELSRSVWVVCTDLTAFGLYLRPRSRFSHTDLLLG